MCLVGGRRSAKQKKARITENNGKSCLLPQPTNSIYSQLAIQATMSKYLLLLCLVRTSLLLVLLFMRISRVVLSSGSHNVVDATSTSSHSARADVMVLLVSTIANQAPMRRWTRYSTIRRGNKKAGNYYSYKDKATLFVIVSLNQLFTHIHPSKRNWNSLVSTYHIHTKRLSSCSIAHLHKKDRWHQFCAMLHKILHYLLNLNCHKIRTH